MSQNMYTTKTPNARFRGQARAIGLGQGVAACLVMLVLSTGFLVGAVSAETSENPKSYKDYEEALDIASSIELVEADVGETFASFSKLTGLQLSMHPAVEAKVTYAARAEKLSDIIDGVCRWYKLECYVLAGEPAILRVQPASGFAGLPSNLDLELVGASLDEVMAAFPVVSDHRAQVSGSFEGELTITVHDQPWPEVLEHICTVHACSVDWSSEPIMVTPSVQGD